MRVIPPQSVRRIRFRGKIILATVVDLEKFEDTKTEITEMTALKARFLEAPKLMCL